MFTKERFPHPYKGCFILFPNRYRTSQSTPLRASPQGFYNTYVGRGFHTLIKGVSFSPQPIWDLTIHPLSGPTSTLTHRPVSSSDTICNSLISLPADIVLFRLPLKVFKTCLLRRGFHALIKGVSFSSPTAIRSHKRPHQFPWH